MPPKKSKNLIIIGLAILLGLILAVGFFTVYLDYGSYSRYDSLFYLFTKIDYAYFFPYLISVAIMMLIFDTLTVVIRYYWHDFTRKTARPAPPTTLTFKSLRRYWRVYRNIHVTFILLTIFLTIAISAPANIMNTFTAIVSISVLVSNLTKN